MPVQANKLSARAVATLAKPGRHSDGGGLYLNVTPTGARSWVFMWKVAGKRREMGLGPLRDVPLAKARELAADARRMVRDGADPLAAREPPKVMTFGEAADALITSMSASWRNAKHRAQWEMTLRDYCAPMRTKPVDEVGTDDVLAVLQPIWQSKAETASRLRGRIERVLDYAKARGLRTGENPARWRGHLDAILPRPKKLTRGHHRAMPFDDVPAFMSRLRDRVGVSARALEFLVLTAARSGEVLGMRWSEVDFDAAVWSVPAERMKGGRAHRVPLTDRAVDILVELNKAAVGEYVFPGMKLNRPLSVMALEMVLRRMKVDFTVHGFRSAFRDWAGERTPFPREIAEAALAHLVGDEVERAYRRGDALEKRRALMTAWSDFVERRSASVVELLRRA
ncbi:tyrosine-type recombinase/integrase [Salinarimonas ramus]|uniref:Integrase n=1 Tax=Salinarimonas ramus TaxID=690164 RepID=A0A917V386_9HYPH|nr:site-specific integrase [Salinarimonas ramus]GGK28199.1 integrase [Salinarimonas ramus]